MSYVYIIGPVRSDPQYKQKRQVLADISSGYQYQFFFPFERYKSFSLDAVRSDLRNAAVVIADLSLERPSCYFELGVAQALDLPDSGKGRQSGEYNATTGAAIAH